MTVPQSNIEK